MDRKGKNYRLKASFSDELDKEINELEKKARMIKKLQTIMNTIKANGLYSDKEMQNDLMQMERLNAPNEEKNLICECWNIRNMANKQLSKETKKLLKQMKEYFKEGEKKDE